MRGEGPRGGGFELGGMSWKQTRGDEIRPTAKAFDVILTGDHGAVSVRDIGDEEQNEEQDFWSVHGEMV